MHFCICFCLFVFVHLTPPSPLCALLVSYASAQITTPSISVALITLDHPNHVTRHHLLMMIVIILTRANNLEYDDHDDDICWFGGGQFSGAGFELSNPIICRRPFCGFRQQGRRSIPYFEFSPQMSRMICANIAAAGEGLGYPALQIEGRWSNRWRHHMGTHRVDKSWQRVTKN